MMLSHSLRITTLALIALGAAAAQAEQAYGISNATTAALLSFDTANPGGFTTVANFSGLVAGQSLRAVDFRPSDGKLYAISSAVTVTGGATGTAQLYTVNLSTGALTTVGSAFALDTTSTRVSMDFNPVVDAIRVVSGAGNNLRVNANTGAILGTDTALAYAPGDPNAGTAPLVADVAYSNNVVGATSTTLYSYEYILDQITTVGSVGGSPQSPNTGLLNTVGPANGANPPGTITAFSAALGFDISGASGLGYLSFDNGPSAGVNAEFFTVNLATGALTQVGADDPIPLLDFSVKTTPVPEPATMAVLGLGALGLLRRRNRKS